MKVRLDLVDVKEPNQAERETMKETLSKNRIQDLK